MRREHRRPGTFSFLEAILGASLIAIGAGCDPSIGGTEEDDIVGEATGQLATTLDETVGAAFILTVTPASQTIGLDDFTSYFVDVDPLDGLPGNVALSASSSPPFDGFLRFFPSLVTPPAFSFFDVDSTCQTSTGDYTLTITGTRADGATASADVFLTVEPTVFPPFASFSFSRENLTFRFFDFSSPGGCNSSAEIVERLWDFGDGTTSTEEDPVHTYAVRGDYRVTLTVTNDEGVADSTSTTVTALPPPPVLSIAKITFDPADLEFRAELRWSGAEGDLIELRRNFALVDLLENDGRHRDVFRSQETTIRWRICELRSSFCSNEVSVSLGSGASSTIATVTTEIDGRPVVQTIPITVESPAAGDPGM